MTPTGHLVLGVVGRRWPFASERMPSSGEIIGGFVVRRVVKDTVYLAMPETPEEKDASEAWEQWMREDQHGPAPRVEQVKRSAA